MSTKIATIHTAAQSLTPSIVVANPALTRYSLVIDSFARTVLPFETYEEAIEEMNGFKRDMLASGYVMLPDNPKRLERPAPDGTVSSFEIEIVPVEPA